MKRKSFGRTKDTSLSSFTAEAVRRTFKRLADTDGNEFLQPNVEEESIPQQSPSPFSASTGVAEAMIDWIRRPLSYPQPEAAVPEDSTGTKSKRAL